VRNTGLTATLSDTTIWRWLQEDAIRPWQHRCWIFPRDPDFEQKAGRVGRRGIADWYFRQELPTSVEAAIKWERNNPQYYDALGTLSHFYGTAKNLDASVAFYESAKRLSPYDAHFWSDLGSAYDWAGRTNDAFQVPR